VRRCGIPQFSGGSLDGFDRQEGIAIGARLANLPA